MSCDAGSRSPILSLRDEGRGRVGSVRVRRGDDSRTKRTIFSREVVGLRFVAGKLVFRGSAEG